MFICSHFLYHEGTQGPKIHLQFPRLSDEIFRNDASTMEHFAQCIFLQHPPPKSWIIFSRQLSVSTCRLYRSSFWLLLLAFLFPLNRLKLIRETRKFCHAILSSVGNAWKADIEWRFPGFHKHRDDILITVVGVLCFNELINVSLYDLVLWQIYIQVILVWRK